MPCSASTKTTLSYAAIFGLEEDLHLKGTKFSWLGALFYLGYFGLGVSPNRAATALGIWIGSAGLGYVVAGIASFDIGHIHSATASWRLLYIIWGTITVAWGLVLMITLPGSPLITKFLSEAERTLVVAKVRNNGTGVENETFKWTHSWEAMVDLKTWLLFLFAVASNSPNGGLTSLQGLIIRGMGFSILRTTLIQMPSAPTYHGRAYNFFTSHHPNRRLLIMIPCIIPFLAGVLGLWLIAESNPYGGLASSTAGHSKKITVNAMVLTGYCLGNFIGPFLFQTEQAPAYPLGVSSLVALWALLWVRNRKRREMCEREDIDEGLPR
ncbi:major facilitator superfamily domain-containing protein [Aspergillus pseudodeflectus]|uniref:Major facilitator superfamily domain-containing protein n=1 Tax=Aspergillus pseudodeflectus TaxID=176178 RepID=A0ABR4KAE4_9EURO